MSLLAADTPRPPLWIALLTAAVILSFSLLGFFVSTGGLRGSDQYWYVADTESLLSGHGVQTNNITLYSVVNDSTVDRRGFVHNVPQVYLAVVPGYFLGAYHGWLLLNAASCTLAAFLLFRTLRRFVDVVLSALVALLFLTLPLTFWQSYQPLGEAFQALLVTAMLHMYCARGSVKRYLGMALLAVLLLLCRNNYILVAIAVPVLFFLEYRGSLRLVYSITLLAAILGLAFWLKQFFPDTYDYSYYYISVSGKVGQLTPSTSVDLVSMYWTRLLGFFRTQFLTLNASAVFYVPFNLLLVGIVVLWVMHRKPGLPIVLGACSFMFLLLTAIVAQMQARYLLPFYPLVLFASFVELRYHLNKPVTSRVLRGLLVAAITLALTANAYIARGMVEQGKLEHATRLYYTAVYDEKISTDESLLFCNQGWDFQMMGYILRPRKMFLGDEETYFGTDRFVRLIEAQKINWTVTKINHGQRRAFPFHRLELEREIPAYGDEPTMYLYRVLATGPDTAP